LAELFLDLIRERFPEAERLAFERVFARGHNIFFDPVSKRMLPQFSEGLVYAALLLAKTYVAQVGAELVFTAAEERFFRGCLVPPAKLQSFRRQ
jgi:hypothetical protein